MCCSHHVPCSSTAGLLSVELPTKFSKWVWELGMAIAVFMLGAAFHARLYAMRLQAGADHRAADDQGRAAREPSYLGL
jgi:hypothetical protein